MGWNRKVLRVNLTAGTCTEEALNMQWADEYLGSRGLATKYLVSEIDPKVDQIVVKSSTVSFSQRYQKDLFRTRDWNLLNSTVSVPVLVIQK